MKKTLFFVLIFVLICSSVAYAGLEWDVYLKIMGGHSEKNDYSYEGHNYEIIESAVYNLGSTDDARSHRDLKTATKEGLVHNAFYGSYDHYSVKSYIPFRTNTIKYDSKPSGTYNIVSANVIFNKPGPAFVTLESTWDGQNNPKKGESVSTTKYITVRKCPYLDSAVLGGEQRAYRKQILTLKIAQNPNYPITNYDVRIDGAYCRPIQSSLDEANEFLTLSVEFLCKNAAKQNYKYVVSAIDSRGSSMQEEGIFEVLADQAPNAFIKLNEPIYRCVTNEDGQLVASIVAKSNGKISDDNVEYTWVLPAEAKDIDSSVNDQRIFTLKNAGYYEITLKCKDIWKDTLPEFVSESERKESSYTYRFAVNNKRPKVSLSEIKTNSLELVLLNPGDLDLNEVSSKLSDANIEAEIKTANYKNYENPGSFTRLSDDAATSPFYSSLKKEGLIENCAICDGNYLYKLVSSQTSTSSTKAPFYIYRYDINDLTSPIGILEIPSTDLAGGSISSYPPTFVFDESGNYIVVIINTKSIIINKNTNEITAVSTALGSGNIALGSSLYSITKTGLIKVDIKTGSYETVCDKKGLASREKNVSSMKLLNGDALFLMQEADNSLVLAKLNTKSETISFIPLQDSIYSTINDFVAISESGRIVVCQRKSSTTASQYINAWNIDGSKYGKKMTKANLDSILSPVFTSDGEVNYVYETYKPSSTKPNTITLWNLETGAGTTKTNSTVTALKYHLAGIEFDDGSIAVLTNADQKASSSTVSSCWVFNAGKASEFNTIWGKTFATEKKFEAGCKNNNTYIFSYSEKTGTEHYSYIYEFERDSSNIAEELKTSMLSGGKDYQIVIDLSKEEFDLDSIIKQCAPTASAPTNEVKHFKVGDKISYTFNYYDPEGDPKKSEHYSIDLANASKRAGSYSFDYYVYDDCGNSEFSKKSNVLHISFVVGDIEKDPEPEVLRVYKLHRKY